MYLNDLLSALRRRWYLTLAGLFVTLGLAAVVLQTVPVTYTSTTSMLLLPPRAAIGSRGNPYMNLGGLTQALEVLSTRVNASSATEQVSNDHLDAELLVGPDTTTTGPILLVSVTAPSAAESLAMRDTLVAGVPPILIEMQDELEVKPNSRITISTLATDVAPEREIKDQLRAVIAVVGVGGAATILGTGYLDSVLSRRAGNPWPSTRRRNRPKAMRDAPVTGWWADTPTTDTTASTSQPTTTSTRQPTTTTAPTTGLAGWPTPPWSPSPRSVAEPANATEDVAPHMPLDADSAVEGLNDQLAAAADLDGRQSNGQHSDSTASQADPTIVSRSHGN